MRFLDELFFLGSLKRCVTPLKFSDFLPERVKARLGDCGAPRRLIAPCNLRAQTVFQVGDFASLRRDYGIEFRPSLPQCLLFQFVRARQISNATFHVFAPGSQDCDSGPIAAGLSFEFG